MTCPRCGSVEVDSTTMGGIISPGAEHFDDANRSTCTKCRHKGNTGDWERLDKVKAELAAMRAERDAARSDRRRCGGTVQTEGDDDGN